MPHDYEQSCRLATGLDVIGERWTFLIVRELLFGSRRFTDLLEGLPGIPPSLLSARLKEMQKSGVVFKEVLPPPAASTVYQLTDAGKELEPILLALGRWGARFGRQARPTDAARPEWAVFALRCLFRPGAAADVHETYELRLPDGTFRLSVDDGALTVGMGSGPSPDLTMTGELTAIVPALMGHLPAEEAVRSGTLRIEGDQVTLRRLLAMFRLAETESGETDVPGLTTPIA